MLTLLLAAALTAPPSPSPAAPSNAQRSLQALARVVASQVASRRFRATLATCRDAGGTTSMILYANDRGVPRALYWTNTPAGAGQSATQWRFVYDEAGRLRYVQAGTGGGNTRTTAEGFLNATGQEFGAAWPAGVARPLDPRALVQGCQAGRRPS